MRAAVIGGSGQIGGWLLRALAARGHDAAGTYATAPLPGLTPLDAGDLDATTSWVRAVRPDVVFYPAGFTWVDGCERDPQRARDSNLVEPLRVARLAAEGGGLARFVYFSSDYVFDGALGPYTEDDRPNPLSVYGQVKRDAELAILEELGDRALVVRTTWVYGPERQGKNFAYQLSRVLAAGKPLFCPLDQLSTPTYGPDVAAAAVGLVEQGRSGLVHVAGPEVISRVDFARTIAEAFRLDPSLVIARTTAELGQGAARPLNSGLLTPKLDDWLPGAVRPVSAALLDFLERLDDDLSLARLFML
jgi:dTDP-4-dehydrorhamnose reductase